jgi:hypothetical protein
MASRGARRRVAVFARGEAAWRAVTGRADRYVCPLCGEEFSAADAESGQLTLEDVPPRSVGGRPLCLTCKPCNDRGGHATRAFAGGSVRRCRRAAGRSDSPVHCLIVAETHLGDREHQVEEVRIREVRADAAPRRRAARLPRGWSRPQSDAPVAFSVACGFRKALNRQSGGPGRVATATARYPPIPSDSAPRAARCELLRSAASSAASKAAARRRAFAVHMATNGETSSRSASDSPATRPM